MKLQSTAPSPLQEPKHKHTHTHAAHALRAPPPNGACRLHPRHDDSEENVQARLALWDAHAASLKSAYEDVTLRIIPGAQHVRCLGVGVCVCGVWVVCGRVRVWVWCGMPHRSEQNGRQCAQSHTCSCNEQGA